MDGYSIKATGLKTGTQIKTCRVYKGKTVIADAEVDDGHVTLALRTPRSETDEVIRTLIDEVAAKFAPKDAPIMEETHKAAAAPKAPRVAKPKAEVPDVLLGKLPKTLDEYKAQLGWTPASGTKEAPIKAVKKCLCGCGAVVERNFLPGHDARFKGQLIRTKDPNRNAIMKEIGWEKYISSGQPKVAAAAPTNVPA